MASRHNPGAASTLLTALFDGDPLRLEEATRTRVSVHYETGDASVPVLSVCTPDAVRLPCSLVTPVLPCPGPASVRAGELAVGTATWRVARWWLPPRLVGLGRPSRCVPTPSSAGSPRLQGVPLPCPSYDGLSPGTLVGKGPGLTPAGDDVLAGALVTAHAVDDPRLPRWRRATCSALASRTTTAVSRGLLHHALDGYATPELAALVTGLCQGRDVTVETDALLAVGHTSGAALLAGVLHVLSTHELEGAA